MGSNSGLALSENTLGASTGAFVIPFVVIQLVGSPVALGLIALINAAMGIALAFGGRIQERLPRLVTWIVIGLLIYGFYGYRTSKLRQSTK